MPSIRPTHIAPTLTEISDGRLSAQNIERALYALHFDGLVVLENAVDHSHLETLNQAMIKDTVFLAGLGEDSPYNYHKGASNDNETDMQAIYNRIRHPTKIFSFVIFSSVCPASVISR